MLVAFRCSARVSVTSVVFVDDVEMQISLLAAFVQRTGLGLSIPRTGLGLSIPNLVVAAVQ